MNGYAIEQRGHNPNVRDVLRFYKRRLSGILVAVMSVRSPHLSAAISLAVLTILSACTAGQPAVVEQLDELTAVTVTHSRTPIILSPDTPYDEAAARDYVQVGAIEVNRMGALQYFLWLGIWDIDHITSADNHPKGYESIVLILDGDTVPLDVLGWTHEAIGTSEPVYKKLFKTSVDAYYQVTLEQISLLTEADDIRLRTSDSAPKEFVPWYRQTTAKKDLAEFLRMVTQ